MAKDNLRSLIDNMISPHISQRLSLIAQIENSSASGVMRAYEESINQEKLLRNAFGLNQYQQSQLDDALKHRKEFELYVNSARAAQGLYRFPEMTEVQKFLESSIGSSIAGTVRKQQQVAELLKAIDRIHTPWLNSDRIASSINGLVTLQNIGQQIQRLRPFEESLSVSLRDSLGDWRKKITFNEVKLLDPVFRSDFYHSQGFNPALTDFPAEAFSEAIEIAGLVESEDKDLRSELTLSEPSQDAELINAISRTNEAHATLMIFEMDIRKFIVEKMNSKYGDGWINERVDPNMLRRWNEKQKRALRHGEEAWHLIAFADFKDYLPIITHGDHWDSLFGSIFESKDAIQEAFQRLYPIRICTMHARPITQDDQVLLVVETRRIKNAIGVIH